MRAFAWYKIMITSHNRALRHLACGVSLSNAAHASQSPQSIAPRAVAVRDVSLSQLAPHIHQFADCHRTRPAAAVRYRTWVN